MNHQINRLIHFGLQHHLISEDDEIYAVNLLLDLFHLDHFTKEEINEKLPAQMKRTIANKNI